MPHQERNNIALSLIIEQGIDRDRLHGSVLAWKFLAAHAVPEEVISRVLGQPAQRRRSDDPAFQSAAAVLSPEQGAARH